MNQDDIQCTASHSTTALTLTLTTTSTQLPQTIPAGEWIFNLWVTGISATQQSYVTYTGKIQGYFADETTSGQLVDIEMCNKQNQQWTSGPKVEKALIVESPTFIQIANLRDQFEFSFRTNTEYFDFGRFYINLGFLGEQNSNYVNNIRCAMYRNNELSHDFAKFSIASLANIEIQFRELNAFKATSIGLQSYKFKCSGIKMPAYAPTVITQLNVTYQVGSGTICTGATNDLSKMYDTKVLNSEIFNTTKVAMTKGFNSVGQEANYTFKISTRDPQYDGGYISTPRTFFQAGSTIFIEFARDIAPRFSKGGVIRCEQDNDTIPYWIIGERKLAFEIKTALDPLNNYGHNFTVYGISQPKSITKYNTLYFGIAGNSTKLENLTYYYDGLIDTTPNQANYTYLQVNKFNINSTTIRDLFTMQFEIVIQQDAMKDGYFLYAEFASEFDEAFYNGFTPFCLLYNTRDDNKEAPHNYASNCIYVKGRRIQIFLSNDTLNLGVRRYSLEIQNIPQPIYETQGYNMPLLYITWYNATTVPVYKSNKGFFNGTSVAFKSNYTSSQTLIWADSSPYIILGTYGTQVQLMLQTKKKFQQEINPLVFANQNISNLFNFYPSTLAVLSGKSSAQ
eukprot:TRINITY_DN5690_c0_g1_i4.p1 TRINITY_DN5690_c0_g1~~TRINITY_DN5690_c0_g1_i4.p1  ORF type:complete len:622 (-),score=47.52 TRINITY_DN5690_c0_g1_i4:1951-3816(-)